MFDNIKMGWREAGGKVLRKQVEDCIIRLQMEDQEVHSRCAIAFATAYLELDIKYCPLSNVSNEGKRRIAKEILRAAKQEFVFDMGRGNGLFLLSAHLEAQTLPGEDASWVRFVTQNLLDEMLVVGGAADTEGDRTIEQGAVPPVKVAEQDAALSQAMSERL